MFAETIVALAQKLNLDDTVAEGVETAEQGFTMRALGRRTAQGYLYARPMPLQVLKVAGANKGRGGRRRFGRAFWPGSVLFRSGALVPLQVEARRRARALKMPHGALRRA